MKKFLRELLRLYLYLHERVHERVFHSLAIRAFGGLHPKNIYNYRSEFFVSNVQAEDVVIDIACGSGRILGSISARIKEGLGLDYSEENLRLCRENFSARNLEFRRADILDFNYGALRGSFPYNKAIFSHILEHIEDVPSLLRAVGAPEILICVPSQENWYRQTLKHLQLRYTTDPTHFREYTRQDLADEVGRAGYSVLEMTFNSEGEIICRAARS